MKDSERIELVMSHLGIKSVTKFAKSIGRDRPDAIYNVLKGVNDITDYLARDIVLYHPQFNPEWLRFGTGDMILPENQQKKPSVKECEYCKVKDEIIMNLRYIIDEQRKTIDQKSR